MVVHCDLASYRLRTFEATRLNYVISETVILATRRNTPLLASLRMLRINADYVPREPEYIFRDAHSIMYRDFPGVSSTGRID